MPALTSDLTGNIVNKINSTTKTTVQSLKNRSIKKITDYREKHVHI